MDAQSSYEQEQIGLARAAVARGYADAQNLREILIFTTLKCTAPIVEGFLTLHHNSRQLLEMLFAIASEGEDAGDAPWAAANCISDFPPEMLQPHVKQLVSLSKEEWMYLREPAKKALAKIGL